MAKCANCNNEAAYYYTISPTVGIDYCSRHVPKFLKAHKNSGLLVKPAEVVVPEPVVEVPKPKKPKGSTIEEPAVSVIEEDAPTEE